MLTLRCTPKVLKRLGATPSSAAITPTTRLGDWYAGAVPHRPPLVLFVNEPTLLPVLVAATPNSTLLDRWRDGLADLLRDWQVPDTLVAAELDAMHDVTIGTTASRTVLGDLEHATRLLRTFSCRATPAGLLDAEHRLAELLYADGRCAHPRDATRTVFGLRRARPHRRMN
jgi:hypothetical protein